MNSTGGRVVVAVAAVALVAVLFFVLRDDGEESGGSAAPEPAVSTDQPADGGQGAEKPKPEEPKPEEPKPEEPEIATIEIKGGQPVGGVAELEFTKDERIQFVVRSDVADHVHLHGYDVFKDLPAGGAVEFDVPATIEGVFEAELEDRVVPIAEITVNPG